MIAVRLNGEPRELPDGLTIAGLIELLELKPEQVAVERNGALVRRAEHATTELAGADVLEIVTLVGGG